MTLPSLLFVTPSSSCLCMAVNLEFPSSNKNTSLRERENSWPFWLFLLLVLGLDQGVHQCAADRNGRAGDSEGCHRRAEGDASSHDDHNALDGVAHRVLGDRAHRGENWQVLGDQRRADVREGGEESAHQDAYI